MKMILFLYVLNIYLLGQVLTREKEHLVQTKKGNWLIKTEDVNGGKNGQTKNGWNAKKNKKSAEHNRSEQLIKQLGKEDLTLFLNLPADKKKEVLKQLRKLSARNGVNDWNAKKNKKTAEQNSLEQYLKQLGKEDLALFQNLPADKKKVVLKQLRKHSERNGKAGNDYFDLSALLPLLMQAIPIAADMAPIAMQFLNGLTQNNGGAGQQQGNNVAGLQQGNNVAGLQQDSNVAGLQQGNNVAGLQQGNNVAGLQQGNTVAGPQQATNVAGLQQGNNVAGPQQANIVAGLQRVSNVAGLQQANNGNGLTQDNNGAGLAPAYYG